MIKVGLTVLARFLEHAPIAEKRIINNQKLQVRLSIYLYINAIPTWQRGRSLA